MKKASIAVVRYRMQRAKDALRGSILLLSNGLHLDAASRCYYACFHAVSALLHCEGYDRKKHAAVMAVFFQYWIKPRRLPVWVGTCYTETFHVRMGADYSDCLVLESRDVSDLIARADELVRLVGEQVEQRLAALHADESEE